LTLYEGNCGLADKDFLRNIHGEESNVRFGQDMERRYGVSVDGLSEPERDRLFRAEVKRLIREHPGRYALLSLERFVRLWGNVGYVGEPPSRRSLAICAVNGLLLLAFIVGLFLRAGAVLPGAARLWLSLRARRCFTWNHRLRPLCLPPCSRRYRHDGHPPQSRPPPSAPS